ncbi:cell division protein FtsL [Roseomonas marmotae]|uniref:Cell division protein FtsL n=1 Tax=Roseomonas marmotae TaxID=2768161 RepID=A0ABS3KBG0_9PROT|nr:hypothetical protein [Roseomonas marmotae]MBO1074798.1 hypothetical protein [Roseomonas marmotae]QTI80693.1 hypothetical protein IAI58_08205 [Roseomonas marmotae]
MFRPLTVIAITAFCVVGWNVYRAEDSARQLDRELRDLTRRIEQARDRTQVLRAEWALLNEPERLRQVAQKYLPLETMQPAQFVRLQDVDRHLPTAIAFAGPVNLFGSAPETALAAAEPAGEAPAAAAPAAVAEAKPSSVTPAPAEATALAASMPATPRPVTRPAPAPRVETVRAEPARSPAPVVVATREEPRRRPVPAPTPRAETVALREAPREPVVAEARSSGLLRQAIHLPINSANAGTLPQPGTGARIGVPTGSSLGLAARGTLAPPVPLAAPVPVR